MSLDRKAHNDTLHYGPTTRVHYTDDDSSQVKIGDADPITKGASITAYLDPTYSGCDFASNCYFDGTDWVKFDATLPAHSLYHSSDNDRTSVWRSAVSEAQGQPIANWTEHTILEADIANGLALLGPLGEVLGKEGILKLPVTGLSNMEFYDRTSGERMFFCKRAGANDNVLYITEGGASVIMLSEGRFNSTNGVSQLVATPASATATGTAGQIAYDASYFYVCIATDTWERTALSTW